MLSADSNLCGGERKKRDLGLCLGINNKFKRGAYVADTRFFANFAVIFRRKDKTDYTLIYKYNYQLWHF